MHHASSWHMAHARPPFHTHTMPPLLLDGSGYAMLSASGGAPLPIASAYSSYVTLANVLW